MSQLNNEAAAILATTVKRYETIADVLLELDGPSKIMNSFFHLFRRPGAEDVG